MSEKKPTAPASYEIDDAGKVTRTVEGKMPEIIANYENGVLTYPTRAQYKYNAAVVRFLKWEEYKIEAVNVAGETLQTQGPEITEQPEPVVGNLASEPSVPAPAVSDPEPAKTARDGDKTPAWMAWKKRTDPEGFAKQFAKRKFTL